MAMQPINLLLFANESFMNANGVAPSIDSFLQSFRGLRELKSTYGPAITDEWTTCKGIAWSALEAHSNSLRILHIDDVLSNADTWEPPRSIAAFDKLCTNLVNLEQLSIRPLYTGRDLRYHGFMEFLDCLKHLRSLTALKLMVRPHSMMNYNMCARLQCPVPPLTRCEMQELADLMMSILHDSCPRLTAIVLHATGNFYGESTESRLFGLGFGYMRAAAVNQYGVSSIVAHPIHPDAIKYHEPCSDIFEENIRACCASNLR